MDFIARDGAIVFQYRILPISRVHHYKTLYIDNMILKAKFLALFLAWKAHV